MDNRLLVVVVVVVFFVCLFVFVSSVVTIT